MKQIGLAGHLQVFHENEIRKDQLIMELKKLRQVQDNLEWPINSHELPIISWESFQKQSETRPLVLIAGFIHDLTNFADQHPGGSKIIRGVIGKDATTSFFGGVITIRMLLTAYTDSHLSLINIVTESTLKLLAMKRVGILHGGYQASEANLQEHLVPASQRLRISSATNSYQKHNGGGMTSVL